MYILTALLILAAFIAAGFWYGFNANYRNNRDLTLVVSAASIFVGGVLSYYCFGRNFWLAVGGAAGALACFILSEFAGMGLADNNDRKASF